MKNSTAAWVFTWFIILRGTEVEWGLGALQTHLSPVCDSLQLHSVTVVLLQSLQIHPALSLQQETNKKNPNTFRFIYCYYTSVWETFSKSCHCTSSDSAWPGPVSACGKVLRIRNTSGAEEGTVTREIASRGPCERAVLSEPPRASSLCWTSSIPPSAWTWWVPLIDYVCFDILQAAGCFQSPRGAKVETSSTCVNSVWYLPPLSLLCHICYVF